LWSGTIRLPLTSSARSPHIGLHSSIGIHVDCTFKMGFFQSVAVDFEVAINTNAYEADDMSV
jgi:hypothetical protein